MSRCLVCNFLRSPGSNQKPEEELGFRFKPICSITEMQTLWPDGIKHRVNKGQTKPVLTMLKTFIFSAFVLKYI